MCIVYPLENKITNTTNAEWHICFSKLGHNWLENSHFVSATMCLQIGTWNKWPTFEIQLCKKENFDQDFTKFFCLSVQIYIH